VCAAPLLPRRGPFGARGGVRGGGSPLSLPRRGSGEVKLIQNPL